MSRLKYIFCSVLILLAFQLSAQTDKETTSRLIKEKHFVFNATSARPMPDQDLNRVMSQLQGSSGAGLFQLIGSAYDVRVSPDSIVAFLPYYGRAFNATIDPNDAGIKFTSKKFTYQTEQKKKGNWIIRIHPQDVKDGQRFTLNISEKGYATLYAYHNQRQTISFDGYISEAQKEKQ